MIAVMFILFSIGNAFKQNNLVNYCYICKNHTMCLSKSNTFKSQESCLKIRRLDLFKDEIEWILHKHNSLRQSIAQKKETGFSNLQNMMQLFWDEELAAIAGEWAEQCNLLEEDLCRDVKRFKVLQNVNSIFEKEANQIKNSKTMILKNFLGSPSVTFLNTHLDRFLKKSTFNGKMDMTDSIGLYNPMVVFVGCSRAIYWIDNTNDIIRVEKLICNYGPLVNTSTLTPPIVYCKRRSTEYTFLCLELHKKSASLKTIAEINDNLPEAKDFSWKTFDSREMSSSTSIYILYHFGYLILCLTSLSFHYYFNLS